MRVVLTKLRLILNITTGKNLLSSERVQDESKIINMLLLITNITRGFPWSIISPWGISDGF